MGLSLLGIGQLAKHCRLIVGINTSPLVACLSRPVMEGIDEMIVLDTRHGFTYPKCVGRFNSIDELRKYQSLKERTA
jgi:hypothetical protein